MKVLFNALIRVSRNPAAADRAVLSDLDRQWREVQLPEYRQRVLDAEAEAPTAPPDQLAQLIDTLGRDAGIYLWYLAIVGGSAWKMEACLTRFARQHLPDMLPEEQGGAQVLLRGLPGTQPVDAGHAVLSTDWYHPVASELSRPSPTAGSRGRHAQLAEQRTAAEQACRTKLTQQPRMLAEFEQLLRVNQRYAVIREEQARDFTLAWPVLRTCVRRLGEHLAVTGILTDREDVFFCTRAEVAARLAGHGEPLQPETLAERRQRWQRQRSLAAPLTLGTPVRLIGDVIDRAVQEARGPREVPAGVIVGHPASAGRATGPVHIVHGPDDFDGFRDGDVLVAKATAPAWTPLFGKAAAVVTDGGTLAAHASLVAREYGIPAVVGTGDATTRLSQGQLVTVDGAAGTVTLHEPKADQA